MGNFAVFYDPRERLHATGDHEENAGRTAAIARRLRASPIAAHLDWPEVSPAGEELLGHVHPPEYIRRIEAFCSAGGGWATLDTVAARGTSIAARLSAGALAGAVDTVMRGSHSVAFSIMRPPGHHALPRQTMGFCFLSNVAIAARHAMHQYGLERILIVDFDVHHGNGTQAVFEDDPHVLFFSTHQFPFYPGSGDVDEIGSGRGLGFTGNVPLGAGAGDAAYQRVFEQALVPLARRFEPELILVSAGYDAHWADPLGQMNLTLDGYVKLVEVIRGLAAEHCKGKMVLALEGGYNHEALARSVEATIATLVGGVPEELSDLPGAPGPGSTTDANDVLDVFERIHRLR